MKRTLRPLFLLAVLTATGCTLDQPAVPALTGPSGLGLSVTLTATPDVLLQDGTEQSVVVMVARDASGQLAAGQSFYVQTRGGGTPNVGTLSVTSVTTNSQGGASVVFTAPTADAGVFSTVTVEFIAVGTTGGIPQARSVSIRMVRPTN